MNAGDASPSYRVHRSVESVHVIGDIAGALGYRSNKLFAHFMVLTDDEHWHVMQGSAEGYTQVDETSVSLASTTRSDRKPRMSAHIITISWTRNQRLTIKQMPT